MTIADAAGNAVGAGTLSYNATAKTLRWTPPSGTSGTAVDVSVSGNYAIQGGNDGGVLKVVVVASSLPNSDLTNTITIANLANKMFDDVSKDESLAGDNEYRCFYLQNNHASDKIVQVKLWVEANTPGQDNITIGLDPAGKNGTAAKALEATKAITAASWAASVVTITATAHGYAVGELVEIAGMTPSGYNGTYVIASVPTANTFTYALAADPGVATVFGTAARYSEAVAPAGATFSNPVDEAGALSIGDLNASDFYAFWIKREVPANTTVATAENTFRLAFKAYV